MEVSALLTFSKLLADVALGLLKNKKDDRTHQRLADLLNSIADCVSSIGDSIQNAVHATEKCAELDMYVVHLQSLVAGETNEETAAQLVFWLKHVGAVPGAARIDIGQRIKSEVRPGWSKTKRFEHAEEVREIAGIIRAFGNLVRV